MIQIQRILCPIDFSDHSRRALDHAIAIARWYDASITVMHVFAPAPVAALGPTPGECGPIFLTPDYRDQLIADLKTFAGREVAPGVPFHAVVREGNPAGEVLHYATDMKADLLILGTHGRSGFERLLLGSVAEKVLRKARCPVMTVPKGLPDAVPAGPVLYKRILCPVDFSESSLHALKYAISLAQESDGRVTILHVVEHEFEYSSDVEYHSGMTVGEFLKAHEDALERRLKDFVTTAPAFCRVESMLRHGKPWREVLRAAGEGQSDLVVMGVLGRGAADLMLFGSTTQHVVRDAACPVLTLRHVS